LPFFIGGLRSEEKDLAPGPRDGRACCVYHHLVEIYDLIDSSTGVMQLNSSLLSLSVIAVLLPAAFHFVVRPTDRPDTITAAQESHEILSVSHGVCGLPFYAWI